MHVFLGLYLFCNLANIYITVFIWFLQLLWAMSSIAVYPRSSKIYHPLAHGLPLEILYFSVIERIANAMGCIKKTAQSIHSKLHRRSEGESTEKETELGGSQSREKIVFEGDLRFAEENPIWKNKVFGMLLL